MFLFCNIYADTDSSEFTDIKGHWAEKYIINVVDNGYMNGVSTTKFNPDTDMENYDTIVAIAKLLEADKEDLASIEAKFVGNLKKYLVPVNISKYAAFCIEKGIISEYDLEAFQKNKLTKKKDVCMYLGKAFGVKTEKASPTKLGYKDALFIGDIYVPHIEFLINNGILDNPSIFGGNFNQGDTVKRSSFAKLIDMASQVYARKGSTTGAVTVGDVKIDNNGSQVLVPGNSLQGYFVQSRPEFQNFDMKLRENGVPGQTKTYNVTTDIKCTIDGKSINFWEFKDGDLLTLVLADGKATRINGESKQKTIVGVLTNTEQGEKTYITIDLAGDVKKLLVDASSKITKDGYAVNVEGLKKGNRIEAVCEYDKVIEIKAKSQKATAKGVIQSITYSLSKLPAIIVKDAVTGENGEYSISTEISKDNVIIMGTLSDVYSLRPGMNVSLDIENEEILRVVTIEKTSEAVKFDATIKEININLALITVEIIDITQQTAVQKKVFFHKAVIRDFKDLNAIDMSSLKVGDRLIITGMEELEGIAAESVLVIR